MRRIYIAGPYTHGDVAVNVRTAMEAGVRLIKAGFAPHVPHLSHFLHLLDPQDYETWMRTDQAWLVCCDAVLRLPGYSPGADREVASATELGLPIYHSVEELCR